MTDELQELRDYASYIEDKVQDGEMPLTLEEWREFNTLSEETVYPEPLHTYEKGYEAGKPS